MPRLKMRKAFVLLSRGLLAAMALWVSSANISANAQTAVNQPVSLDRLLAGMTRCDINPELTRLWQSVADRFRNDHGAKTAHINSKVALAVPRDLAGAIHISRATSQLEDAESTIVRIPVSGTFQKIPLRHLEFVLGNENGISIIAVEFEATPAQVTSTFGDAIRAGNAILKRRSKDGSEASAGFGSNNTPSIWCNRST